MAGEVFRLSKNVNLKDYTLIVPSVSVGNVGQLAVDLWISSLDCDKIGCIWHPAIMPVVGGNPFTLTTASNSMMMSSEIFCDEEKKLVFLQIRSPMLKTFLKDFLRQLVSWIVSSEIGKVVILTGSSYTEGKDAWITGNKLRYIFSANLESDQKATLERLQWTPNEKVPMDETSTNSRYFVPGCGYALMLYDLCVEGGVRAGMLIKFCSEGDNVPDAYELADYLNGWLKAVDGWKSPYSWKHLFGKHTPKTIW